MVDQQPEQEVEPYTDTSLWSKLSGAAKSAGSEVVERALRLHYAAQREDTPAWAKSAVYGAIAYFILPIDAIPDFVPLTGYSDDLLTLTAALTTVSLYVNDDVKLRARNKLRDWFGKPDDIQDQ